MAIQFRVISQFNYLWSCFCVYMYELIIDIANAGIDPEQSRVTVLCFLRNCSQGSGMYTGKNFPLSCICPILSHNWSSLVVLDCHLPHTAHNHLVFPFFWLWQLAGLYVLLWSLWVDSMIILKLAHFMIIFCEHPQCVLAKLLFRLLLFPENVSIIQNLFPFYISPKVLFFQFPVMLIEIFNT